MTLSQTQHVKITVNTKE